MATLNVDKYRPFFEFLKEKEKREIPGLYELYEQLDAKSPVILIEGHIAPGVAISFDGVDELYVDGSLHIAYGHNIRKWPRKMMIAESFSCINSSATTWPKTLMVGSEKPYNHECEFINPGFLDPPYYSNILVGGTFIVTDWHGSDTYDSNDFKDNVRAKQIIIK